MCTVFVLYDDDMFYLRQLGHGFYRFYSTILFYLVCYINYFRKWLKPCVFVHLIIASNETSAVFLKVFELSSCLTGSLTVSLKLYVFH